MIYRNEERVTSREIRTDKQRDTDRQAERQRQTSRETETDKQRQRQTNTDRQAEDQKQTNRDRDRQAETDKHMFTMFQQKGNGICRNEERVTPFLSESV